MQLIAIKNLFFDSLNLLYPKQEIISLFDRTVEYFLDYSKIEIHQKLHKNIDDIAEKKILDALNRLKKAEPIQYVLGETYFYNCNLFTDKRALIPRPETEYLVDQIVKEIPRDELLTMIDLGTGSGCIAIALALFFIRSTFYAMDISPDALALAKANAVKNHVQIDFILDDILDQKKTYPAFDIIVSNPPYVRNKEKKSMHRNVLDYEPSLALIVEDDKPLKFYKAIADFAVKYLKPDGTIYLEINEYLSTETASLYQSMGFSHVEIIKDINNKNRFIKVLR